ncbi:MAG: hypothetical protein R6X10_15570 [Desulfobacterales bacterium]
MNAINTVKNKFEEVNRKRNKIEEKNDNVLDYQAFFETGNCPFCYNEEFNVAKKKIETDRKVCFHFCFNCERGWASEWIEGNTFHIWETFLTEPEYKALGIFPPEVDG